MESLTNPALTLGFPAELDVASHTKLSKHNVTVERSPSVARTAWNVLSTSVRALKAPTPNHVTTVTEVGVNILKLVVLEKVFPYS